MKKRCLELFSGTHSIGKALEHKYNITSLDRDIGGKCPLGSDYESPHHIQVDIMKWDYKKDFKEGDFYLITASPVCMWWSKIRDCWIGIRNRKMKNRNTFITREDIENDINKFGKPMVDKVIEIIEYFKPSFYWIENPQSSKMKYYIEEKYPEYNIYYDFDYCKYSNFGYKKTTRFFTNIPNINPLRCKKDCENLIETKDKKKIHKIALGSWGKKGTKQTGIGGGNNRLPSFRIPEKLILTLTEEI
jgi:hypothetical protein